MAKRTNIRQRGKSWVVHYRRDGRQVWRSFKTRDEAELELARAMVRKAQDQPEPSARRMTLAEHAAEWLEKTLLPKSKGKYAIGADNFSKKLLYEEMVDTPLDRILAIGKGLDPYDCFDTGVFAIGPALFAALRSLETPSLTEGMRVLAAQGTALTVDCGDLLWMDVDDQAALHKAERLAALAETRH